MRLEIYVQPVAAGGTGSVTSRSDKLCGQALAALRDGDHRLEDEGVSAPIPRNVHESNEVTLKTSAHPT